MKYSASSKEIHVCLSLQEFLSNYYSVQLLLSTQRNGYADSRMFNRTFYTPVSFTSVPRVLYSLLMSSRSPLAVSPVPWWGTETFCSKNKRGGGCPGTSSCTSAHLGWRGTWGWSSSTAGRGQTAPRAAETLPKAQVMVWAKPKLIWSSSWQRSPRKAPSSALAMK